jgi:hypothetical protein
MQPFLQTLPVLPPLVGQKLPLVDVWAIPCNPRAGVSFDEGRKIS